MRLSAPLALALVLAAAPAAAMWDGIRWNMSPSQVIAAGKGQLARADGWSGRRVKPTRRPSLMLKDRVAGERELGGIRVQTTFWFDPNGRLWSVTEEAIEADFPAAETCARLEAALVERYGERDLVTDKGEQRYIIWRDEANKTRIHLREGEGGDCVIEYRELRGPLDR